MKRERDLLAAALPAYEIGHVLGAGAAGTVYAGRHRQLGREVAIKQLSQDYKTSASRHRFRAEARLLAGFNHPHLVAVHDFVEVGDLRLLILERLTGGTVAERSHAGELTPQEACAVVLATCAGLQYAHDRKVLHRDVKPENLLFSSSGVLKVTDFGVAKVADGLATIVTGPGQVVGTPAYMAPEQIEQRELTSAADVYATGTVLFELLSGRLPYSQLHDLTYLLYQRVYEEPASLAEVAPQVPEPLALVTDRAIARTPEDRYPTAESFGSALAEAAVRSWGPGWLAGTGHIFTGDVVHHRDQPVGPSPPPADAALSPSEPVERNREIALPVFRPRRRRRRVTVGMFSVAIVAIAGAYALLPRGETGSTQPTEPPGSLVALDVAVSLQEGSEVLRCPNGRIRYLAVVSTNGAPGTLTYQWTRPDASSGAVSSATLPGGQRTVSSSLEFTFTGQGTAEGIATFEVLGPTRFRASAPSVTYTCP